MMLLDVFENEFELYLSKSEMSCKCFKWVKSKFSSFLDALIIEIIR